MNEPRKVKFIILGEPNGKGRPKFDTRGPYVRAVTPKKTANYEALVKMEYQAQCDGFMFSRDAALGMLVTAYKPIPKSTSKKKRVLMIGDIIRPTKKPDWDNVGKIVCDALNKIAFCDDTQIVDGRVIKLYAEQPRVEVEIWQLGIGG
nr:MAG TPA: Endodeoxyribonuclease RusA [Caudoviricetes sp.]